MISIPKNSWRITKYNPISRNENGAYLKDEWISFSDIGLSFEDEVLTFDEYRKVENAYVSTALKFFSESGLHSLKINSLEMNKPYVRKSNLKDISYNPKLIENGLLIADEELESVCRLILRDVIWCRLESESRFYIHFGYDYYMYIGSSNSSNDAIAFGESQNLYIEDMISPYILDEESNY